MVAEGDVGILRGVINLPSVAAGIALHTEVASAANILEVVNPVPKVQLLYVLHMVVGNDVSTEMVATWAR